MIYKAKFRFTTNRTTTGDYEKIELTYLCKAFNFAEAETELKTIINKNHDPKNTPFALAISIVSYGDIIMLDADHVKDYDDYHFYEVKLLFKALTAKQTLKKENKTILIQEYSMDAAKKKAIDIAHSEKQILFDDFEIKKITETDIYEVYL